MSKIAYMEEEPDMIRQRMADVGGPPVNLQHLISDTDRENAVRLQQVIATRVRELRNKKDVSMVAMANAINERFGTNFSQTTISRIESGDRRLTVEELMMFAAELDVSPATLMFSDGKSLIRIGENFLVDYVSLSDWFEGEHALDFQDLFTFFSNGGRWATLRSSLDAAEALGDRNLMDPFHMIDQLLWGVATALRTELLTLLDEGQSPSLSLHRKMLDPLSSRPTAGSAADLAEERAKAKKEWALVGQDLASVVSAMIWASEEFDTGQDFSLDGIASTIASLQAEVDVREAKRLTDSRNEPEA